MRKKILVISPVASHPQNCGNRARIYTLLSGLKKMGHEIHFLYYGLDSYRYITHIIKNADIKAMKKCWDYFYITRESSLKNILWRVDRKIGRIGIFLRKNIPGFNLKLRFEYSKPRQKTKKIPIDSWYPQHLDEQVMKLSKKMKYDIVLVEYVYLSKALQHFNSDTLKIIDTHDVFSGLYNEYKKNGYRFEGIYVDSEDEALGLNRADVIIAIQDKEKKFFSKLADRKIVTIGHNVRLCEPKRKKSVGKKILFVGANIAPNQFGINHFIKEIFPKVRSKFPDVQLLIAGAICNLVENSKGIIKLGEIKDIKTAYDMADIVINPVSFGSGLKIKTIEAMGYSKPLVTTLHGAAGLESQAGKSFLVAKNSEEFEKAVSILFSNSDLYGSLSRNAYNFARKYNQKNMGELKKLVLYNKKNL